MERQEIEAELNEVERDLSDIARRAHIAASNLRSVADEYGRCAEAADYRKIAKGLGEIKQFSAVLRRWMQNTRKVFAHRHTAAEAAGEGGAE